MSPDSMASGWYFAKRGDPAGRNGPLSWQDLYARAQAGQLSPGDLVWNPQLPEWLPAAQIPGLFPGVAPQPAPLPAPLLMPQPMPQPTAYRPARRRSVLAWLIPLIALIIVGGALGAYFGFWYHHGVTAGVTSTVAGAQATTTTSAGENSGVGTIELTVPDQTKIVKTSKWGEVPANQLGVILADGKTRKDADQIAQTLGGTVVGELDFINLYEIQTDGSTEGDLQAAIDKATALAGVEDAFPNQETVSGEEIWGVRQSPLSVPAYTGDAGGGYKLIGVQKAWDYIKGSGLPLSGVKVGIVDNGLYKDNGEFGGPTKVEFPDPNAGPIAHPLIAQNPDGTSNPEPDGSHCTGVAGIIGADPTNGGQAGIASGALRDKLTISAINIFAPPYGQSPEVRPNPNDLTQYVSENGKSYAIGSLAAMLKQVEAHAKVINCSFGASEVTQDNALVAAAYRRFLEKMAKEHPDVTFVCAAGNYNGALSKTDYWPAGAASGLPNVITVGNVTNDGEKADTSDTAGADGEVTISAPGDQAVRGVDAKGVPINDQYPDAHGWTNGGGTSMATPQVTAAAALLLSLNPKLQAADIKRILTESANPGPENMGGTILSIDKAVLEVVNEVRQAQEPKLPILSAEQLEGMGVIDAVATSTDKAGVYSVRGILAVVPDDGTNVTITGSSGVTIAGEATQHVTAAGDVTWPSVSLAADKLEGGQLTVTVTREDTGAASVISFEQIDLNGKWSGTFTITEFNVDQATATTAQGQEGCDLGVIAALFEKLKNVPIPMTMDITEDTSDGTGNASTVIDFASVQSELNQGTEEEGGGGDEGDTTTFQNSTETIPFTVSGDTVTFHPEQAGGTGSSSSGGTSTMTATVNQQGGTVTMEGTLTGSGSGVSMTAVFTLTKQ